MPNITNRDCTRKITDRVKIYDAKCSGLYVSLSPTALPTFYLKYTCPILKTRRVHRLGVYADGERDVEFFRREALKLKVRVANGEMIDARTEDHEINRLKHELEQARDIIIGLAPEEFFSLLHGYTHTIETVSDLNRWQDDLRAAVIAAAKPFGPQPVEDIPGPDNSGRAICPLCRSRGSRSFGRDGWALPGGLAMHLGGKGVRAATEKCPVIETAKAALLDKIKQPKTED